MQDTDAELLRLKDLERQAFERFRRLSWAFADHPEIGGAAKILWEAAAAAVLAYQRKCATTEGITMLDRDRRLLTGQTDILLMLARDAPAPDTLTAIVRLAELLEPAAIAGVTIVDRAERELEMAVFPSLEKGFADAIAGVPLGPPHVGTCAQALYKGEVVTSEDLKSDTRFAKEWLRLCGDHGIQACRSHPICNAAGSPLGTFMLCYRDLGRHDSFDASLMATCAQLIELTLERRRKHLRRELVMGEFQHRTKNLLGTVGALARFSYENTSSLSDFLSVFQGRINALSAAQDLLLSDSGISLRGLLEKVLAPYSERVQLSGPTLQLDTAAVTPLSMTIHELATNAVKYGALSAAQGQITVDWEVRSEDAIPVFILKWSEKGGPPVETPTRRGFGTQAIEQMLASEIEGRAEMHFDRAGLRCTIEAPIPKRLVPHVV